MRGDSYESRIAPVASVNVSTEHGYAPLLTVQVNQVIPNFIVPIQRLLPTGFSRWGVQSTDRRSGQSSILLPLVGC